MSSSLTLATKFYARDRVELDRSTLADWGGAANALTDPLLGALEDGGPYKIEDDIRGKLPDERKAVRQGHAAPLLKDLYDWLRATARKVSKKSPIASAIGYTLSLWTALTRYAEDGSIEIDNNPVERELRAAALGRKIIYLRAPTPAASALLRSTA